jgi:hypothetical protein
MEPQEPAGGAAPTEAAPPEDSPTLQSPAAAPATAAHPSPPYEPLAEEDEWMEEPLELPRRPRRRLLSPVPLALFGVLITACGFIGGVLVEKGQASSSTSAGAASGLASRFAALRGGSSGTGSSGASAALSGAFAGRAGGVTAGQVAYLAGGTLYVTTAEGNTVKVTTSPATSVSKTVKASVPGIHPGETVTVTGASASDGAISAESIRVGAGVGGGLGALFGAGAGTSGKAGGGKAGAGGTGGGEPALFGNGGG